jgi:uncharacterized protein YndB with AHSA1/START domain
MRRWVRAITSLSPGGSGVEPERLFSGATLIGRFVELVPHRRLGFTYGWEDGWLGVPPESTTVEIDLIDQDGATTVRLVHRGLPPDAMDAHAQGWAYFLGVLRDIWPAD